MPWLINASQLDKFRKNQKNVIILDASWHLPAEGRNAYEEFLSKHIVGARFFDIDQFSDQESSLPNMLIRDETAIGKQLGDLGITNDHKIIFYDNSPLHSSCRALWMMKVFGHNPNQLYILDGGLDAWMKYDNKIESDAPRPATSKIYNVNYQGQHIRTLVRMKTNLHHPKEQVVDVRHAVRYAGGPENRADIRPGHIPGSFSFPYITMFESDGRFKPMEKIRKQLQGIGVDFKAPIITSCGSGITSAILNFLLDLQDQGDNALYDGSWSEWGSNRLYPGEESLAERPVVTSLET